MNETGTTAGRIAALRERGVVAVTGPEAADFLHGVVTATIKTIRPGEGRFGALLTPQGKVLFDFFVTRIDDGFLIDVARAQVADFVRRLGFYRLRAAVKIADRSADFEVHVGFGGPIAVPEGAIAFADPRHAGLGSRLLVPPSVRIESTATAQDWQATRIDLGVPESGRDFALGEVFPHDVDMDDLGGVDFKKGCFIGQEVVSRMKHRGTARKRIVLARALEARPAWPDAGTEITCAGKTLGTLGSSADGMALALVRLDRAKEAIDLGDAIEAGGVTLALELPEYARFGWPETAEG